MPRRAVKAGVAAITLSLAGCARQPALRYYSDYTEAEGRSAQNMELPRHPTLRLPSNLTPRLLKLVERDITQPAEASAMLSRNAKGKLALQDLRDLLSNEQTAVLEGVRKGKPQAIAEARRSIATHGKSAGNIIASLLNHLLDREDLRKTHWRDFEKIYVQAVVDRASKTVSPPPKPGWRDCALVHVHANATHHSQQDLENSRKLTQIVLSFNPQSGCVTALHAQDGQVTTLGTVGAPIHHLRLARLYKQTRSKPPEFALIAGKTSSTLKARDDRKITAVWINDGSGWKRKAVGKPYFEMKTNDRKNTFVILDDNGQYTALKLRRPHVEFTGSV